MKTTPACFRGRNLPLAMLMTALITLAPAESWALSGWGSSYAGGVSRARSLSKPLLVVIARKGCPACEALERNLARNAGALKSAVRVRVEADHNPALTSRYASAGTPTILVFTRENGYSQPIYSYTGVMGSSDLRRLGRSLDALAARKQ